MLLSCSLLHVAIGWVCPPKLQPGVHVGDDCACLPLIVKNWTMRLLSIVERTQATLKVVWKTAMASPMKTT